MVEDAPCDNFAEAEDVLAVDACIAGDQDCPDYDIIDAALAEATQILYLLSGRQVYGICSDTVRPSKDLKCPSPSSVFGWRVGTCDDCCTVNAIKLSGPVVSVDMVMIDGEEIPASGYALMDSDKLVRMRDADGNKQRWPRCQKLDLPPTEAGTFAVTYTHGRAVDAVTKRATIDMAIELIKLGSSETSRLRLPSNTTSVTRQGVSLSMQNRTEMIREAGSTIESVAEFMALHNPANQRIPTFVYSPDTRHRLHKFS